MANNSPRTAIGYVHVRMEYTHARPSVHRKTEFLPSQYILRQESINVIYLFSSISSMLYSVANDVEASMLKLSLYGTSCFNGSDYLTVLYIIIILHVSRINLNFHNINDTIYNSTLDIYMHINIMK